MFTGLVADTGALEAVEPTEGGTRLRVGTDLAGEIAEGDSVAVNGCCLTAVAVDAEGFAAEVMNETLRVTSLGSLSAGDAVNLELAVRASDRLGGHVVQGHVDATGTVLETTEDGFARRIRIGLPPAQLRQVVERGSIAIEGVSLTVAALGEGWVEVSLIPETLQRTTLGGLAPGRTVNVETDILAKYVHRAVGSPEPPAAEPG